MNLLPLQSQHLFVRSSCLNFAALLFTGTIAWLPGSPHANAIAEQPSAGAAYSIEIDATRLPRKLLESRLTIPVDQAKLDPNRKLTIWYPKWVPGAHAPGGPIANVAGIVITDQSHKQLSWQRTPGEVYRVTVSLTAETTQIQIRLRYITNQPSTGSFGCDSFGSDLLGIISPNTVLMCAESADVDQTMIAARVILPETWQAATALSGSTQQEKEADNAEPNVIEFKPVSLRTFVDSPIMCGQHYRAYDLVESGQERNIPPHQLHVFSEAESVLDIDEQLLSRFRSMVTQTARLMGSHPFDSFDILLATTDMLPANGLEHARSTLNVLGQRTLQAPGNLKGWNRLLIPHEYLHSWCGKFRIPSGMMTHDFHAPLDTELLWVYEGLTQYLGELIEARSGLMEESEFRDRLSIEVRQATYQQGRQWRSLQDTGAASHLLRDRSAAWSRLRRSQDYYMEGMLFWLEADAIIRGETKGAKSLDDFCQAFFACGKAERNSTPKAFNKDEVVRTLNEVVEFDWQRLIQRRIELPTAKFQPEVVERLGLAVQYSNEPADIPDTIYRSFPAVDAYDSIGCSIGSDGVVNDLLLGSAADRAGMGPGMKIVGVNDHAWSVHRLQDAIAMSGTNGQIELMVVNGDSFRTHVVKYDGGPRYLVLKPQAGMPDLLGQILKPRK